MKQQTNQSAIEWKEIELKEICEVKKGNSITKNTITDGDVPVIAGGQQPAYYHNTSNRTGETLTVSGSGAYAGFVAYFNIPIFASDCSTIQSKEDNLSTKYIYYLLKGNQNIIYKMQKGIAQPHVYPKDLEKIKIPLPFRNGKPDLETQQKIVAILEKAEKLKERGKKTKDLLDEYLKSVFNEMFVGKEFEEVELGDKKICLISGEYGSGASAKEFDGKIQYIRITDIDENGNLREQKVSPTKIEDKYLLKRGDLLFARSGATVGKTYLHNKEENFQYAGYLIRFRFNNKIIPEYIYSFTKTSNYLSWISLVQRAVAQPNINAKQYSSLRIPFPPLSLQQKFATIVEHVEKIKENVGKTNVHSGALFDSLMHKAFRGEL